MEGAREADLLLHLGFGVHYSHAPDFPFRDAAEPGCSGGTFVSSFSVGGYYCGVARGRCDNRGGARVEGAREADLLLHLGFGVHYSHAPDFPFRDAAEPGCSGGIYFCIRLRTLFSSSPSSHVR